VYFHSLSLDGAIIADAAAESIANVRNLKVSNRGWLFIPTTEDDDNILEVNAMRGYLLKVIKAYNCFHNLS
jgi:hypothetical protein